MFRRLFWLTLGVILGVFAWRKVQQIAHAYSPSGLAERAQSSAEATATGLRNFAATVRTLADGKEDELRTALAEATPVAALTVGRTRRRTGDGRELRDQQRVADRRRSA